MRFSVARLRAFIGSLFTCPVAGKKLLADNHALRLNNQVLEMLSQNATLPEVFDAMLRIINNYRPGMSGAVLLVSDSGQELAGCSAPNLPEKWLSTTAHLPIEELNGPATAAIRSGNTIIIEDAATDPRWRVLREEALNFGINAAWSQPIKNNEGKVLGVFTLYHREVATPDAQDLALLADYARLAQIVIERARLAGALQESQALYRLITENSNDVIWALQYPTWQYSYISPSAERLRGWKPEELSGENLDALMPPDSVAMCRDILAEHFRRINAGDMTGRFIQFETEVLHREGHSVPIEVVATIMGSPSQPTHIVGSSRDITKRKAAEDALSQAQEQLANQLLLSQTLINAIPSPVFAKDRAGRYLMCNREFEEYSGKSREEILGKDVFNIWPQGLAQISFSADNALFDHPHSQVYDAKVVHRDGSLRDVLFNRAVFRDNSGEVAGIIGVMADITQRKAAEEAIRNMAFFDQLTGLPNRRMMEDRLGQMLVLAKREHRILSLLFVDLDKFKAVNDQHGHQAGDWLLKQVAARMSAVLRTSDTVSRIGGDEFVILLPDIHHTNDAVLVAEKIRAMLEKPFVMDNGVQLDISSSIGVVMYPNQADNMRDLLHSGDEAMYRAKKGGRNAVEVFGTQVRKEEQYLQYP
ncbi:MAG TPA: diguanylate cyclase [Buttiauxella sp.]|uniref:sensor domain-containing diguanylate cyclase n=1 Tax=Buttiauxella sp. TaxID=1972222 RepID=UPI002B470345|nr:diguanylate cyclase [Buttiauxella sp.]HKM96594.1 diguanylate cyclase [Buttiauxella sp.]